jgi:hypothetical protein
VTKGQAQLSLSAQAVTYCDLMSLAVETLNSVLAEDTTFQDMLRAATRRQSLGCTGKRWQCSLKKRTARTSTAALMSKRTTGRGSTIGGFSRQCAKEKAENGDDDDGGDGEAGGRRKGSFSKRMRDSVMGKRLPSLGESSEPQPSDQPDEEGDGKFEA